jgi:hypothetical protein
MNLLAIANECNLPMTRSERSLTAVITADVPVRSEANFRKQMADLAEARDALARIPDNRTTERQRKLEKAAMLKERLKMLRQMIPFLKSSSVKALMVEMKQIASELAGLVAESGGGAGSPVVADDAATSGSTDTTSATGGLRNTAEQGEPGAMDKGTDQVEGMEQPPMDALEREARLNPSKSGNGSAEDQTLKDAVEELKSLYKAVMAALKRKQAEHGAASSNTHMKAYVLPHERANRIASIA